AHLVQDPARILIAEVVDACALPEPQHAEGRRRQLRRERQRLQTGEDAVPTEHGHEPRQSGSRQTLARRNRRREAQRGTTTPAAPVGHPEPLPAALEPWSLTDPTLQASLQILAAGLLGERPTLGLRPDRAQCRDDVNLRPPLTMRLEMNLEGQAILIDTG